jgi:chemotaxis protein histidine kinase CheA
MYRREHRKLMKDILIQLTRNSMTHGLELPADRKAAGKSETGRIEIGTRKSATGTELFFKDDGRGLQIDKLRKKASRVGKIHGSRRRHMGCRHGSRCHLSFQALALQTVQR